MATRIEDPERLRQAALTSACDEFGISDVYDKPFLVMMEFGQIRGAATLIAIRDRNPSLFIGADGEVLCAMSDPIVRRLSNRLIDASEIFMPLMDEPENLARPTWGRVKFFVRSVEKMAVAEQAHLRMTTGTSAFSVFYDLCNDVVAEITRVGAPHAKVSFGAARSTDRA